MVSVAVWALIPVLTLLVPRLSALEPWFRARPYNSSYDTMFVAATAGIAVASAFVLAVNLRSWSGSADPVAPIPLSASWWNALDAFELIACAGLAASNALAGVPGTALVWLLALVMLASLSWRLARAERGVDLVGDRPSRALARITSGVLTACALLFLAFPVFQPWNGPPEPFVRWYPFSVPGELVWRSLFLSFALGMLVTATDPLDRHRPFLVVLVASGYLHSLEMGVDNLLQARLGGMNGNPQHLYGDVLGWFLIASLALVVLVLDASRHARMSRARA